MDDKNNIKSFLSKHFLENKYLQSVLIAIISVVLVFGSHLMTKGGKLEEVIGELDFGGLGLFTLVLIFVSAMNSSSATNLAITDESKTDSVIYNKEKEVTELFDKLDLIQAVINLDKYNEQQIQIEIENKKRSRKRELTIKQMKYRQESKKYKYYQSKLNIENYNSKLDYKSIQINDLNLSHIKRNSLSLDKSSIDFNTKSYQRKKALGSSIITKIVMAFAGSLSLGILIGQDILATIVFTLVFAVTLAAQFIWTYRSVRILHSTEYYQSLKNKILLLNKIA